MDLCLSRLLVELLVILRHVILVTQQQHKLIDGSYFVICFLSVFTSSIFSICLFVYCGRSKPYYQYDVEAGTIFADGIQESYDSLMSSSPRTSYTESLASQCTVDNTQRNNVKITTIEKETSIIPCNGRVHKSAAHLHQKNPGVHKTGNRKQRNMILESNISAKKKPLPPIALNRSENDIFDPVPKMVQDIHQSCNQLSSLATSTVSLANQQNARGPNNTNHTKQPLTKYKTTQSNNTHHIDAVESLKHNDTTASSLKTRKKHRKHSSGRSHDMTCNTEMSPMTTFNTQREFNNYSYGYLSDMCSTSVLPEPRSRKMNRTLSHGRSCERILEEPNTFRSLQNRRMKRRSSLPDISTDEAFGTAYSTFNHMPPENEWNQNYRQKLLLQKTAYSKINEMPPENEWNQNYRRCEYKTTD